MSESVTDVRALDGGEQLEALEKILDGGALDPEERNRPQNAQPEAEATDEDATAPEQSDQPETEDDQADPAETQTIEPPSSLPKELREYWSEVPEPLAQAIVELDQNRTREVRRVQNEAAEIGKQARAVVDQVQQERTFLAQRIVPAIQAVAQQLQAEYSDEALANLARTNPAKWAEKFEERRQLERQAAEMERARQGMEEENRKTEFAREYNLLVEKVPEWADEKKFAAEGETLRTVAAQYGYSRQEIDQVLDHRALLVLRDLAQAKAREAARQAPARKVAQPTPPRTIAPRTRNDGSSQGARRQEDLRNIARSGDAATQIGTLEALLNAGGL